MTQRHPLPSPVDLPPPAANPAGNLSSGLLAQAMASEQGGVDTLYTPAGAAQGFIPGPPFRHGGHVPGAAVPPGPDLPGERRFPAPPGVVLLRLGDLQIGTLIADSATGGSPRVLGRVTKCSVSDAEIRGKARRRRIMIEVEEEGS